jgi:hypothetical protein
MNKILLIFSVIALFMKLEAQKNTINPPIKISESNLCLQEILSLLCLLMATGSRANELAKKVVILSVFRWMCECSRNGHFQLGATAQSFKKLSAKERSQICKCDRSLSFS